MSGYSSLAQVREVAVATLESEGRDPRNYKRDRHHAGRVL